ncbi:MAG: hypothetical protein ACKO81_05565 [Planctomycetota bacterium]
MSLALGSNVALVLLFLAIIGSNIWLGLWNNIITFCNFLIAAIAAHGLWRVINDLFVESPKEISDNADIISIWAPFILVTVILRVVTDSLSSVRLRFHPIVEWTGRVVVCTALAVCFIMFACSTAELGFLSGPLSLKYSAFGGDLWEQLSDYWLLGPFVF